MNLDERKRGFVKLGDFIKDYLSGKWNDNSIFNKDIFMFMDKAVHEANNQNPWFTVSNIKLALHAIAVEMLSAEKLKSWLKRYPNLPDKPAITKKIGIIMAGNIPLVGFHDLLCVLICGYHAVVKLSSKDKVLITTLVKILQLIQPEFKTLIAFTDKPPADVIAVISTGSNNSARYFESWYANIPHIIRKNRSSIAILTGDETECELKALANDVFTYFGLGCRNVSTLFLPKNYDFTKLGQIWEQHSVLLTNKNYKDNYRYWKTVFKMDAVPVYDTGFLLMRENTKLTAPVAVLNYQFYEDMPTVRDCIISNLNNLQCVVCRYDIIQGAIEFGKTQQPALNDYADGNDTVEFLIKLF